jgi:phosphoenolpyruvate phosphomutase
VLLATAGEDLPPETVSGEWMGFLRVSAAALPEFRDVVTDMLTEPGNRRAKIHNLLAELVRRGKSVRVVYTSGHWLDVDTLDDVVAAGKFA